jgi:SAM-dependent methyltransferase
MALYDTRGMLVAWLFLTLASSWAPDQLARRRRRSRALGSSNKAYKNEEPSIATMTTNSPSNNLVKAEIEGYVTAVRGFGTQFCFIDLRSGDDKLMQAMLKQQLYQGANDDYLGIRKCTVLGMKLQLIGHVGSTHNNEDIFVVEDCRILGVPRNPQRLRIVLEQAAKGNVSIEQVARAVQIEPNELVSLLQQETELFKQRNCMDGKPYYSLSKKILETLPELTDYPSELANENKHEFSLLSPPEQIRLVPAIVLKQLQHPPKPITVLEQQSVSETLLNCQESRVCFSGWIQNRRRFDGNITVLEVTDDPTATIWSSRLQCILDPKLLNHALGELMAPGSLVEINGYKTSLEAKQMCWISSIRIVQASWRPKHVLYVIDLAKTGVLNTKEASEALGITKDDLKDIMELPTLTERQWKAAEISRGLQSSQSRVGVIEPELLQVLEQFTDLRNQYPVRGVASDLIKVETGRDGSRYRRTKEPQLEWMTQQVDEVIKSHPSFGERPLRVLDVGGGKGLLANHLAAHLGDKAQIIVVDIANRAIKNGEMRSKRLQLPVQYSAGDASTFEHDEKVDLVVALHAYGALSDVALGHAVLNQASFVICPCCFRSNPQLRVPSGYANNTRQLVSVDDWLSVSFTEYDALKVLAEVTGDIHLASRAMHTICALRLAAAERHSVTPMDVAIKTFPIGFSTRNYCLVGRTR